MHGIIPVALILAGSSGRLARADPVGRLVTGASKSVRLHESLQQVKGVAVALLPVLVDPPGDLRQEVAGQVRHDHGGQDEESTVVGNQGQALHPLLGRPTDPTIPSSALPSRGAKEQTGQIDAGATSDQIRQVLTHRSPMAQVMMLAQVTLEPSILRILGANHLNLQRPHGGQARLDPSRGHALKQVRTRIRTARNGRATTRGQDYQSSVV